ncbi:hypothetical protein LINPERPRIM_LOCUS7889 [Linum perenne]
MTWKSTLNQFQFCLRPEAVPASSCPSFDDFVMEFGVEICSMNIKGWTRETSVGGTRLEAQLSIRYPSLATLILDSCVRYPCVVAEEAPVLECLYLVGILLSHFEYSHCSKLLKHVVIRESFSMFIHQSESFSTIESLSIRQIYKVKEKSVPMHVNGNSDYEAELEDAASEYKQSGLLRKVEVTNVRGREHEMTLISWLLNSSAALEEMKIQLSSILSDAEKMSFVTELNGLQRA